MIIGIDAYNIRAGGGVSHLVELLRAADPESHGFIQVVVWSGSDTLNKIEDRHWLLKMGDPLLDRSLLHRIFWHRFRLTKLAKQAGCNILFIPGGSNASGFQPVVTMSQNLLPFEWKEIRRFGWSRDTFRFILLRWTQGRSFKRSTGVIFLTEYARNAVLRVTGKLPGKNVIIPHGINSRFAMAPREARAYESFTESNPCRVLYVSIVNVYKHQWRVVEAIAQLRSEGVHVALDLVGPAAGGITKLKEALKRVDPGGNFISYHGPIPYERLGIYYGKADINVFASSCETFGLILLEAMSAGLPIACSNCSSMPEILKDAGVYFDPEDATSIAGTLRTLIESPDLRTHSARLAFQRAKAFSWEQCATETFKFLSKLSNL